MKKFFLILLCSVMIFTLVACEKDPVADVSSEANSIKDETSSEAVSMGFVMPTANNYEKITYPLAETTDYFHVTGRTGLVTTSLETDEQTGFICDYSAQGLLFSADCEGDVTLTLCHLLKTSSSSTFVDHYYTVYVDGVRQETVTVQGIFNGEMMVDLPVAKGLARGRHTFEVYRQNEAMTGIATLISVTMNGVPEKWVEDGNKLKIEFLGDSITSGIGINTVNGAADERDIKHTVGTLTYAFVATRILGAEASIVSRGGMTFSSGTGAASMYNYYDHLSYERDKTLAYDHSQADIDLYVISLGTNDISSKYGFTDEQLTEGIKATLTTVREDYPDAKILWVYGQMTTSKSSVIKAAIEEMGGEAKGFYYYCCTKANSLGGTYHPTAAAHQRDGEEVAAYIKTIME